MQLIAPLARRENRALKSFLERCLGFHYFFLEEGRQLTRLLRKFIRAGRNHQGKVPSWAMWLSPSCTRSCKVAVFRSYYSSCWLAFWHCSYWIKPVYQLAFIRTPVIPVSSLVHQARLRGYHFCSLSLVMSPYRKPCTGCLSGIAK